VTQECETAYGNHYLERSCGLENTSLAGKAGRSDTEASLRSHLVRIIVTAIAATLIIIIIANIYMLPCALKK
jgi:hypothetical protein